MNLREEFADKKLLARDYRVDMTFAEFRQAKGARAQMLADLSHGNANAYEGKAKPARKEIRARRGERKAAIPKAKKEK